MTVNEPQHPEVDDLGLTSEDWEDLQNRLPLRPIEPAPGTVEDEAFRRMDLRPQRSRAHRRPRGGRRSLAGLQARPRTAGRARTRGRAMTTTEDGPGRSEASTGQREAARAHLTRLRQDGGTYRSIAAAAALSTGAVHRLASGRRRAQPGTAAAVLTVTSPALPRARLDAGGTRLRLRALHVMGHGSARIARAIGVHPVTIRKLVRGDAPPSASTCATPSPSLYDAWWDKRAPGRTRFERAAATAARKRAIAGNWCAAAALDDDRLDIPGYRPRYGWKPATGTGVAPDIRPPARHHRRRRRRMTRDHRITWGLIGDVLACWNATATTSTTTSTPAGPSA